MITVQRENLKVISGEDTLSSYQWNTGRARHYFCSICGIDTFHQRRMDENEIPKGFPYVMSMGKAGQWFSAA